MSVPEILRYYLGRHPHASPPHALVLNPKGFVEDDHIIAPDHEFVSHDPCGGERDGHRVRCEILIHSRWACTYG
jgi:hypothetical protein